MKSVLMRLAARRRGALRAASESTRVYVHPTDVCSGVAPSALALIVLIFSVIPMPFSARTAVKLS